MATNNLPRISIVTAVYNGATYLEPLIQSVLAQHYPHFEHIIVDDGSTDDGATIAVLQRYPHLKWWSRENKGQYATQNEGLAAADGDLLCIISADDVFAAPDTFSQVAAVWQANPGCDVIFGRTRYMDVGGKPLPIREINGDYPKALIRSFLYVQHCSLFISQQLLKQHNLRFDSELRHVGDWDWIIRVFDAATHRVYLPQTLSIIRVHDEQITRKSPREQIKGEHRYILETYGGHYAIYRLLRAFLTWRARISLGLYYLRTEGVGVFSSRFYDWLRRYTDSEHVGPP